MSEWKNYGETVFSDYGSMGETVPVGAGSGDVFSNTVPAAGFDGLTDGPTVPDIGSTGDMPGFDDLGSKTEFLNTGITQKDGSVVRPATGWLVCIDGEVKGCDYRLYDGYSYIGRGEQNQVAIPDMKISTTASARILYDNESRSFYINECDGAKNPTYLNGKLFSGRVELNPYDVIKLGTTKLMFVPLCTEKFAWEE